MANRACDLLLINPPLVTNVYTPELSDFWVVSPPYNLIVIAASAIEAGYETQVLDADAELLSESALLERTKTINPRWIGFTVMTPAFKMVTRLTGRIKALLDEVKIIVGGAHPTALPKETLAENPSIDFAVRGEGNDTLVELLDHLDAKENALPLGSIAGLAYRSGDLLMTTPSRPPVPDLDRLPMPAWHLLPIERYKGYRFFDWTRQPRKPYASIFSTWGCSGSCSFCSSNMVHGRRVRFRSVEQVMEEVDFLVQELGVRNICFQDDSFTVKRSHTYRICDELAKRKYPLALLCQSRADTVDEEMMTKLRSAGFNWIGFGVESGDQAILRRASKNLTLQKVNRAVRLARRFGFHTSLCFIIGLPGETHETIRRTIRFARKLRSDNYGFTFATPFPGTRIWKEAESAGIRPSRDWDRYDWVNHPPQSLNPGITINQLFKMRRRALTGVVFRPEYVAGIIRNFGWSVFWNFFLVDGLKVLNRFGSNIFK